ncbi:MAG: hypothetical protein KUL79_13940 [Thauera sp.]|nr:hypothetical protein [Thauera sp.]
MGLAASRVVRGRQNDQPWTASCRHSHAVGKLGGPAVAASGLFFCFSIDLNNKEVNSGAFLVDKSLERLPPKLFSPLQSG